MRDKQELHTQPQTTVQSVFSEHGEAFIAGMFAGHPGDESMKTFGSYAPAGARRLMGMDEDYAGFFHLLDSEPTLIIGDFDEGKLGLLRLSINLNPAMVAKVTSWSRSKYD